MRLHPVGLAPRSHHTVLSRCDCCRPVAEMQSSPVGTLQPAAQLPPCPLQHPPLVKLMSGKATGVEAWDKVRLPPCSTRFLLLRICCREGWASSR